ncbi:MAG: hypothetical protein IJ930_01465 [Lachnospiraceae bacterium]|nr:hypothetical protein [Lachnospiraceae bacterium]
MLVLQINKKGYFMSKLLSGADFDLFLLSEAVVKTDVTWQIDGRINEAYFKTGNDGDDQPEQEGSGNGTLPYIPWRDIRGRIRDLIRGKTAPGLLRFQLIFDKDAAVSGTVPDLGAALPDGFAYIMRIDFDGTDIRIVTSAESLSAVVFDPAGRKEASQQWDAAAAYYLNLLGIDSEQL